MENLLSLQSARSVARGAAAGVAAGALAMGWAWAQTCPPTFKYSRLYSFSTGKTGQSPFSGVVLDTSGAIYGATSPNTNDTTLGSQVYKLTPPASGGAWTESALYQFPKGTYSPASPMVFDANGALYGTAYGSGGVNGFVFQLTPPATAGQPWTEAVIYTPPAGAGVPAYLTFGPSGALYGVTYGGSDNGTVFQLTPPATAGQPWPAATIYAFEGGGDGSYPYSNLVFDTTGSLYGVTGQGGANGYGTVFQLTSTGVAGQPWNKTTLYSFKDNGDGADPNALTFGPYGALYGTTGTGSNCANVAEAFCGEVFQLTPPATAGGSWTQSVLYTFQGGADGVNPASDIYFGRSGNLYGATITGGGSCNCGTIFELAPPSSGGTQWTEAAVHSFAGGATAATEGVFPFGGITLGVGGAIYGATSEGLGGVVFELH